jgi:PKD repeat protein
VRKLTVAVAVGAAVAGCRLSDLVTAPADGRVVFTVQPSGATAGQAITPAVLVTVQDAAGNRDTAFSGVVTIQLAANPGGAKLSGDTTASASAGRATFGNLRIDRPGSGYALRASAPDREATISRGFDVRSNTTPPPNQPPVASFSSGCTTLTCNFTDGSTDSDGSVVAWAWDFGDGGTATTRNPSHTYGSIGTFTVQLIVTDDDGARDTTTRTVSIVTPPPPQNQTPVASFASSCSLLTCDFSDGSSDADGTIAARAWDFGDGGTASSQNPSHTYGSGGTYTVRLIVTDNDGAKDTTTRSVSVTAPPPPPQNLAPVASFSSSCTDLACGFTDGSSDADGSVTAWNWNFGDGGTSSSENPSHTYGAGGTYTVRLIVTDNDGAKDTTTRSVSVTAPPPPPPPPPNRPPTVDAGPDVTMVVGTYTLSAAFSDPDGADGPYSYTIDWGDGTSANGSTSSSPISDFHLFLVPGTYRVRVTVTDRHGASGSDEAFVTIILQ